MFRPLFSIHPYLQSIKQALKRDYAVILSQDIRLKLILSGLHTTSLLKLSQSLKMLKALILLTTSIISDRKEILMEGTNLSITPISTIISDLMETTMETDLNRRIIILRKNILKKR
jgi:hypothetical protein